MEISKVTVTRREVFENGKKETDKYMIGYNSRPDNIHWKKDYLFVEARDMPELIAALTQAVENQDSQTE